MSTYIYTLKKMFEEKGHQVDILACLPDNKIYLSNTDRAIEKPIIQDVVREAFDRCCQKYFSHMEDWVRIREVERYTYELAATLFDLGQYDIIHAQDQISARAIRRVKPSGVPLIATINALYAVDHIYRGLIKSKQSLSWKVAKKLEYLGATSADVTLVPSEWLKQELTSEFSIPEAIFKVTPYGFDIDAFREQMNREPDPPIQKFSHPFVIVCPARLTSVKGHRVLIDALRIVKKKKRRDFVCWFIGEGELRKNLETYCLEKNMNQHVVFLGERTDVPALLNQADLMVLPSLLDNLPFAVIEAQAAGKAIVASDAGGIAEMIIHGETGLIFNNQNISQLADRILEVMHNPSLRHKLELNSQADAPKRWSIDVHYKRIMDVYHEALKQKPDKERTLHPTGPLIRDMTRIFSCGVGGLKDTKLWDSILKRLPANYSIPDPAISAVIAKHEITIYRSKG